MVIVKSILIEYIPAYVLTMHLEPVSRLLGVCFSDMTASV